MLGRSMVPFEGESAFWRWFHVVGGIQSQPVAREAWRIERRVQRASEFSQEWRKKWLHHAMILMKVISLIDTMKKNYRRTKSSLVTFLVWYCDYRIIFFLSLHWKWFYLMAIVAVIVFLKSDNVVVSIWNGVVSSNMDLFG